MTPSFNQRFLQTNAFDRTIPANGPLFSIWQISAASLIAGSYAACALLSLNLLSIQYKKGAIIGVLFAVLGTIAETLILILFYSIFGLLQAIIAIIGTRIFIVVSTHIMAIYCFKSAYENQTQDQKSKTLQNSLIFSLLGILYALSIFGLAYLQILFYILANSPTIIFSISLFASIIAASGIFSAPILYAFFSLYRAISKRITATLLSISAAILLSSLLQSGQLLILFLKY